MLVRGYKVILNVYDLFPARLNGCLSALGIGGAYHSGVEVAGTEYAFGGHPSDDQGLMALPRPLHVLRKEAEEAVRDGEDADGSAAASLQWVPPLRSRTVVGWWMGPLPGLEAVISNLHHQGMWIGSSYRLLERNCNHFARAMCEELLRSPHFKPAPGRARPERMVPAEVTRLTSCVLAMGCCCGCLVRRMNAAMPLAPHALQVFHGKARATGRPPLRSRRDIYCGASATTASDGHGSGAVRGRRLGSLSGSFAASAATAVAATAGDRRGTATAWTAEPRKARAGSMIAMAAAAAAAFQAEEDAASGKVRAVDLGATQPPARQSMSRSSDTMAAPEATELAAEAEAAPQVAAQHQRHSSLELAARRGSTGTNGGGAKATSFEGGGGSGGELTASSRGASLSGALRTPGHSATSISRRGGGGLRISTVTEAVPEGEMGEAMSPMASVAHAALDAAAAAASASAAVAGLGVSSTAPSMSASAVSDCLRPSLPLPPFSPTAEVAGPPPPAATSSPPPSRPSMRAGGRRSSRRVFPAPALEVAAVAGFGGSGGDGHDPSPHDAADSSPHSCAPRPSWTSGVGGEMVSPGGGSGGDAASPGGGGSAALEATARCYSPASNLTAALGLAASAGGSTCCVGSSGHHLSAELLRQHAEQHSSERARAPPGLLLHREASSRAVATAAGAAGPGAGPGLRESAASSGSGGGDYGGASPGGDGGGGLAARHPSRLSPLPLPQRVSLAGSCVGPRLSAPAQAVTAEDAAEHTAAASPAAAPGLGPGPAVDSGRGSRHALPPHAHPRQQPQQQPQQQPHPSSPPALAPGHAAGAQRAPASRDGLHQPSPTRHSLDQHQNHQHQNQHQNQHHQQHQQQPFLAAASPHPWSVLQGGFVDLLFVRTSQQATEPPPGVPKTEPGDGQGSLRGSGAMRRATHAEGSILSLISSPPPLDRGHSSMRSEPAAHPATPGRTSVAAATATAAALGITAPGASVRRGASVTSPVTVPAAMAAPSRAAEGLVPPPPPQALGADHSPPSPPARYEILAAQASVKAAGRPSADVGSPLSSPDRERGRERERSMER
ncbi:hypothetical protein GPECTOR_71g537 [Gonium pectorale]|uniref:PPPDE domain-containing protein n=1 Tax=Gonium pectorale TaxID=33097 RepID=A0A150G2S5_GONPE|nr:hypothetical protein GPECTOR_71g537 [Gonium pectorale]|eukprot:KXZ44176.1 hypothetical protein GPECTOR_71g537 [Gonium pectorale]